MHIFLHILLNILCEHILHNFIHERIPQIDLLCWIQLNSFLMILILFWHEVQVGKTDKIRLSITGSAVNNKRFIFKQLHFHWGSNDKIGSEHIIDNKTFPMEIHLIHYNADYGSFDEALEHDDGLAVVAGFFQVWRDFLHPLITSFYWMYFLHPLIMSFYWM